MTARRLALTNKKVRGIPRRLRSLKKWAESFDGRFLSELSAEDRYWNVKIPVVLTLVQGKQTSREIQAICAQHLINATYKIFREKPTSATKFRTTCCIVLPDMFSSELCVFTSEDYFKEHTNEGYGRFGNLEKIHGKSLAQKWGLNLPKEFQELGIVRTDKDEDGNEFVSEHWYFGEVIKHG